MANLAESSKEGYGSKRPVSQAMMVKYKGNAIPVTGRGGPYGCETSRLPHFQNNRLTDGGEL
jgi:hypothetical protein